VTAARLSGGAKLRLGVAAAQLASRWRVHACGPRQYSVFEEYRLKSEFNPDDPIENTLLRKRCMTRAVLILLAATAISCRAQSKPTENCAFRDFDTGSQHNPEIAEVVAKGTAHTLMECGSPKGCISLPVETGSPVQTYYVRGQWTCGYYADSRGAGPAWFRSTDLRPIHYDLTPPLIAWVGTWAEGEDRVRITAAKDSLYLRGNATWHGTKGVEHYGDIDGDATPNGNHLHFAPSGPDGCTVDLVLLGKFILASDNNLCGGLNARFQGFWRRVASPARPGASNSPSSK
jgi:hypothetical protein